MALIQINDLRVRAIIGTHPWERANKQDLIINISLEYDASKAAQSDKLKDALDYEALARKVIQTVEKSKHLLLEKLAEQLLVMIRADRRVTFVRLRLEKPLAIEQAKSVSIEVTYSLNNS